MSITEVFTISAVHLLTQGRVSINGTGSCMYRGPDNLMCAIGPLIRDECAAGCETLGVSDLREDAEQFLSYLIDGITESHFPIMKDLQSVHDTCEVESWPRELHRVACEHGIIEQEQTLTPEHK